MASRFFPDRDGAQWRVWSTVPSDTRGCLPGFESGWLTFERMASGERRRLAPIPGDWEQVAEDRLLLWCRVAEPVRSTRTPAMPHKALEPAPAVAAPMAEPAATAAPAAPVPPVVAPELEALPGQVAAEG